MVAGGGEHRGLAQGAEEHVGPAQAAAVHRAGTGDEDEPLSAGGVGGDPVGLEPAREPTPLADGGVCHREPGRSEQLLHGGGHLVGARRQHDPSFHLPRDPFASGPGVAVVRFRP
jgi:hypothetical protein